MDWDGLMKGIVVMMFAYPILFIFGVSKISLLATLYLIPVAAVISSSPPMKGRYRVRTKDGWFEDEIVRQDKDFFYFKERAVRKSEVLEMKKIGKEEGLQRYFH